MQKFNHVELLLEWHDDRTTNDVLAQVAFAVDRDSVTLLSLNPGDLTGKQAGELDARIRIDHPDLDASEYKMNIEDITGVRVKEWYNRNPDPKEDPMKNHT